VLKRSRVMNDDEIYEILSYLTLKEKLKLSHVSKQFFDWVNESIRFQKRIKIRVTYWKCFRLSLPFIIEEDIGADLSLRELDFNTYKGKLKLTFRKLTNLKRLILLFDTINNQFWESINTVFPSMHSFKIDVIRDERWNINKFYHLLKQKQHIYWMENQISDFFVEKHLRWCVHSKHFIPSLKYKMAFVSKY